jgi:uncharacterized membrane protein
MNKLELAGIAILIAAYIVFRVSVLRSSYRRQRNRMGAARQSPTPKNTNTPFH